LSTLAVSEVIEGSSEDATIDTLAQLRRAALIEGIEDAELETQRWLMPALVQSYAQNLLRPVRNRDRVIGQKRASYFASETDNNAIWVFTPHNDVYVLPTGSTPVDLAYAVHTDIGNGFAEARIDGQTVKPTTPLENGIQILVSITKHSDGPKLEWATTQRARRSIRSRNDARWVDGCSNPFKTASLLTGG